MREDEIEPAEPKRLDQLFDWKLALSDDDVYLSLRNLMQSKNQREHWQAALPTLLDDFQQLLRDALDLLRELNEASDRYDRGHSDLPSISPHWQNKGFRDWVALIELVRDAWIAVYQNDLPRAQRVAQTWFTQPYPTFKRLALFAATNKGLMPAGEWVEWLLADDAWWLWSENRETMRLLVLQGAHLPATTRARLEAGILAGPPREMFRNDIEPEAWRNLVDHAVWLRLAKLASGDSPLGGDAQVKRAALSAAYPQWQLSPDERDEFSFWMSGTGDPDFESRRMIDRAPRNRRELVTWLQRLPSEHTLHEDNWREVCCERFFASAYALCDLAHGNQWPFKRWREALYAWNNEKVLHRSWRYIAPVLQSMPDDVLLRIAHSAARWLQAASEGLDRHEATFLELCRRILAMEHEDEVDTDQPLSQAINHPVGHIAQALLHFWFRHELNDKQGLPDDLKPIFTELCDTQVEQYRHARVLLASRLITLFRVDPEWTKQYLLPRFSWSLSSIEAHAVWKGFPWSPRLYRPLLVAFKEDFLETARHYAELREHGRQYAAVLTYAALDPADTFSTIELREAIRVLPQEGLQQSVQTLLDSLESAAEQREQHWRNRILPYWRKIWPKSRELASQAIAEGLAYLVIAARTEFPNALNTIADWLQKLEQPDHVIYLLQQSDLCKQFPKEALSLLDAIIADQPWAPSELDQCLDAIARAWPEVKQDHRYQQLMEYVRRR